MPNYFENINAQDAVCKILQSQIQADKISHAYLFVGPAGCGKLKVAKALAKSVQGENSVSLINSDCHPDVRIYNPQGINTYLVDQIKEIVADSSLAPISGKFKFYIIQNSEKLGSSAANAFLKTLEEPNFQCCFILLANNASNVLPTIVSRCQVLNFSALPYDKSIEIVSAESGAAPDDAKMALNLFGGNTTQAIEFCLDQNLLDLHSEVNYTLDNIENFSDWETLQKSNDIVLKINEILDVYKQTLEEKTDELSDVLDSSALTSLKKQNKRSVSAKQNELLKLVCSSIKLYIRNIMLDSSNQDELISTLNVLSEIEQNLSYNINMQNFIDVVLLTVKHKGNKNYD